ncbi:P-loop NTPase fold protein [Saccharothrix deserti]|uniref:P-loop NTPase fold protein n=1 Tax=Saccharothrix deserti TaxID=2593674 RepID=UPI00131BA4B3|nr:P-loop NTPase fold protein [Saccharothrix deserti]
MATQIFISYAEQDRDAVEVLVENLPDDVETARAFTESDVFIVLMSWHYLRSERCRLELDLALAHRQREGGPEIVVLRSGDETPPPSLADYRQVTYVPPLTARTVPDILAVLERRSAHAVAPRPVPFVGRTEELRALVDWCESAESRSGALVVGAPGTGKTRLARELCSRMAADGWNAGFSTDPKMLPSSAARTLVVIDYAEIAAVDRVGEALGTAAGGRARVLLLLTDGPLDRVWGAVNRSAFGRLGERPPVVLSLNQRRMPAVELRVLAEGAELPSAVIDREATPLSCLLAASLIRIGENFDRYSDFGSLASRYADSVIAYWRERLGGDSTMRSDIHQLCAVATLVGVPPDGLGSLATELRIPLAAPSLGGASAGWDVLPARDGSTLLAHESVLVALVGGAWEVLDDALGWVFTHPDHAVVFLRRLGAAAVLNTYFRRFVVHALPQLIERWPLLVQGSDRADMDDVLSMCISAVAPDVDEAVVAEWRKVVRDAERGSTIEFFGMGDQRARADSLDRGAWIDVLTDLLAPSSAAPLDGDATGPSVIAVDGPWGAGKTSLMGIVRDRLDALPGPPEPKWWAKVGAWWRDRRPLTVAGAVFLLGRKAKPESDVPKTTASTTPVTVWFNPWAHQSSDQIWAGLARSILAAVNPKLHPHANGRARYWLRRNAGRLDRRALRLSLVRSALSPMVKIAFFALWVPIGAALLRYDRSFTLLGVHVSSGAKAAAAVAGGLVAVAVLDTVRRFLFGRAATRCPAGLLDGPVLSGTLAQPGADVALRDPLYHARSGYLYLLQHDIRRLLVDAAESGLAVVVFVDDLDRCGPRAAGEVLEAVNLFLSEAFPATRFVIGLDMGVVAGQIDHAMKDFTVERMRRHFDDPSPGWTFLRKLVQLPVLLPRIEPPTMDRLVSGFLGPVDVVDTPALPGGSESAPAVVEPIQPTTGTPSNGTADVTAQFEVEAPVVEVREESPGDVTKLERHPLVRRRIQERLDAFPVPSARETKRLLTVWQFYLRVLSRGGAPVTGADEVRQARAAVLLAEIVVRWPAVLPDLFDIVDGEQGLTRLHGAADGDDVTWTRTAAKVGLDRVRDATAAKALRQLLLEDDSHLVTALARRLF